MCKQASWEPFHIEEKKENEPFPFHRCYLRCTADECSEIKIKAFNEDDIDIEFIGDPFNDPYIEDMEENS